MPSILPVIRQRREHRLREQSARNRHTRRGVLTAGLFFSTLLGLLLLLGAFAYSSITADLPSIELIPALLEPQGGLLLQPTQLYDRTGQHLLGVLGPENAPRRYHSLDPQSPLARITLALEDPGLYTHSGFTLQGLGNPSGHPTLAQRLAADLLLWQEPPGLRRALRERILAWQLTQAYGPDQLLEWRLNITHYGRFAYGPETASQLYFGKSASSLTLAEAALLATTAQAPAINPLDAPQAASQRQAELLTWLEITGVFPADEIQQARLLEVELRQAPPQPVSVSPAVTSLVLAQLETTPGYRRFVLGGAKIITTIDYSLQLDSQCAASLQVARLAGTQEPECTLTASLPPMPPNLQLEAPAASALVMDPRNGQIMALVGETRLAEQASFTALGRPGTLLTPFIYLAGFTRGLSPASLAWDVPGEQNSLENLDGVFHGPIRLRLALANDYLVPAGQVFNEMGSAAVLQTVRPFGLEPTAVTDITSYLDGQQRVSMPVIAAAYSIFAANGVQAGQPLSGEGLSPSIILSVSSLDNQPWLDWSIPQTRQVTSPQLAYLINNVLSDESARWPSLGNPNPFEIGLPIAAKTAQTLDGKDSWAVGYSTSRTVLVWMGGSGPVPPRVTAGLWSALMQTASRSAPAAGWAAPPGVSRLNVCDPSGQLPTEACPNIVSEVFVNGYEPLQADTLYQQYRVNRETGLLATVFTPPNLVEVRTFINFPAEALEWAVANNLQTPPTAYDTIQPPPAREGLAILSPGMFETVTSPVTVSGSAGGVGFASYRLQAGQGLDPQTWILISEGNSPVENGVLGVWDTGGLGGLYTIQLVVVRADQRVETTAVQVTLGD